MELLRYPLKEGECVKYRVPQVQCVEKGSYTNVVLVTNKAIYVERRKGDGLLDGVDMIELTDICDVSKSKRSNQVLQLALQLVKESLVLSMKKEDELEFQALCLAIDTQRSSDGDFYSQDFFVNIVNEAKEKESTLVAKSIHGHERTEETFLGQPKSQSLKDIEDGLTAFGNSFREAFGMKHKLTNAEKQKLEIQEEHKQRREIHQKALEVLYQRVKEKKLEIQSEREKSGEQQNASKIEIVDDQLKERESNLLLQQLENLLEAGVLTREEFEKKRKDIE